MKRQGRTIYVDGNAPALGERAERDAFGYADNLILSSARSVNAIVLLYKSEL